MEQVGARPDPADLVGVEAVPRLAVVEREAEAPGPAVRRPGLLPAGDLADVVVLDTGEVPHEPGDAVGLRVEAGGERLLVQAVDGGVHGVGDAAVEVEEEVLGVHGPTLRRPTPACTRGPLLRTGTVRNVCRHAAMKHS